jgi:DNA-binding NtrC family response regulator
MTEKIPTQPAATTGPRILIADDEESFGRLTAEVLRREGYLCDYVNSAQEAARALGAAAYDLLITDINMPGNTNLEFLRDVSKSEVFMPVIVATGFPSVGTAIESLRLAAVDYVVKPLSLPGFLDQVRAAVEKGKTVRVMRSARQNFGDWLERMKGMEEALIQNSPEGRPSLDGSLDWYLEETLRRFANLSVSLMSTIDMLKRTHGGQAEVCSLMYCPRLAAYEDAIRNTVDVLVQTKNTFKSKELAELRRRLEVVLRNTSGS